MILAFKLISRLLAVISKTFGLGTGVAWSGEIALFLNPNLFPKLIPKNSKIALIAGTNGKTTTAKMVATVLGDKYSVVHNDTGGNLLNGLVGTILINAPLFSKKPQAFVFEVDESNLPILLKSITPDVIVLLNLFRDQLDRYGEVDAITEKWLDSLSSHKRPELRLIVNGDDPALVHLAQKVEPYINAAFFFGLGDDKYFLKNAEHATDSTFCPNCGAELIYKGVYFSHLGQWHCKKCDFRQPTPSLVSSKVVSPLEGTYNLYNTMAATLTAQMLGVDLTTVAALMRTFSPAFGRLESITKDSKNFRMLLSKNPAGFNASLRTVLESKDKGPLILLLNDQVPDGRDISWIWDVDFEMLKNYQFPILVSGERYLDLALRLKHALVPCQTVEKIDQVIKSASNSTLSDQVTWILPTYTAMLQSRKVLTGKSIL